MTSRLVHEFAAEGLVNIVGGWLRHHARPHWRHCQAVEKVPGAQDVYAAEA